MKTRNALSRREFLAGSAGLAAGMPALNAAETQVPATVPITASRLALNGGPKAVTLAPKLGKRWGEPERERLNGLISQDTLFYWKGPQTTQFVERFKQICPLEYVMPCSSGTAALHIAVLAAGVGLGDEVITAPITDIGTVIGVLYQQGIPVFADLKSNSYNLDPTDVARRITPRTKAIIAVHLCGNPCQLRELRALSDQHGLVLIEDCAQAWGARYQGHPIGTIGHIACFSLQNSKHITCGDGGVVASSDKRFGPVLQKFGDKGYDRTHGGLFEVIAPNYRMTEAQAAIAGAQLDRLENIVRRRSELGNLMTQKLGGIRGIHPHAVDERDRCGYWFYFLRLDPRKLQCDRAEFVKALVAEGVEAGAGYIAVPLHRNPVFLKHGFFSGRWPVKEMGLTTMDYSKHETPEAEAILKTGVRLTIHEGMSEEYVLSAAEAVRKVAAHYAG